MNPGDLELFSTRELIDELLRRSTFQGVIIHAKDEAKTPSWDGERVFTVRHNANLEIEQAARLLDIVRQHIENIS